MVIQSNIRSQFYICSLLLVGCHVTSAFTTRSSARISAKSQHNLEIRRIGPLAALGRNTDKEILRPFADVSLQSPKRDFAVQSLVEANSEAESTIESDEESFVQYQTSIISSRISKWTGTVDEERLAFPELRTGEVSRTFR